LLATPDATADATSPPTDSVTADAAETIVDFKNAILTTTSGDCANKVNAYAATVEDVQDTTPWASSVVII